MCADQSITQQFVMSDEEHAFHSASDIEDDVEQHRQSNSERNARQPDMNDSPKTRSRTLVGFVVQRSKGREGEVC